MQDRKVEATEAGWPPMRALFLVPLLLAASTFVPAAEAQPPCPPDACCKGILNCLEQGVGRLLDEFVFGDVCHESDGRLLCVSLDPRSPCVVREFDGAQWRCIA